MSHELQVQEKREVEKKQESTVPARTFVPATDIFESGESLTIVMEMAGVDKKHLNVSVENGVLNVEGRLGFQVRRHATGLHRVQHRPLPPQLFGIREG